MIIITITAFILIIITFPFFLGFGSPSIFPPFCDFHEFSLTPLYEFIFSFWVDMV